MPTTVSTNVVFTAKVRERGPEARRRSGRGGARHCCQRGVAPPPPPAAPATAGPSWPLHTSCWRSLARAGSSPGCHVPTQAGGNEAAALVNAVLGNIIGIFITPAWLSVFLDVAGQAPYTKVRRRATGAQACAGVTCA